ncbi:MAG TPA: hypothetical protein VFT34_14795 [Verrucomicrobiae bacterium]|nr:hypothetical protein [Verrucomicrobiae bacterium]
MPHCFSMIRTFLLAAALITYAVPASAWFSHLSNAVGESPFSETFRQDYEAANAAAKSSHSLKPIEDLLLRYQRLEEQAELHVTLGYGYGQWTGFVRQEKSIEHFGRALKYDLPPILVPEIFTLRGNAHEQLKQLDLALADYIRGLFFCLRYDLPPFTPDLMGLDAFDPKLASIPRDDPNYAELTLDFRLYDRQIRFEAKLLMTRYFLIDALKLATAALSLSTNDLEKRVRAISKDEKRIHLILAFAASENIRPWK